jgi:hypothetical protein
MEPIFFNVEDISEYIIILLLITLCSIVKAICLYQSVPKVITWAPTLADSTLLHLCIDFVSFFFVSWKKPIDDSKHSAPFSFLLSNVCNTSEGCYSSMLCANASTFGEKRAKACASINFSFFLGG